MEELTIISPAPVVPKPPEHVPDGRRTAALQIGRLITEERQSLCLLRVISAAGVMAHATTDFIEGQPVAVGFRSSHVLRGEVRWIRKRLIGIAFDQLVDIEVLTALQRRAVEGRFLPESVRLDVHGTATIDADGERISTELFDISLAGAKIGDSPALRVDMGVTVNVPGLPPRSGSIRWQTDGRAGIAFNLGMPYEVLSQWILRQPPRVTLSSL